MYLPQQEPILLIHRSVSILHLEELLKKSWTVSDYQHEGGEFYRPSYLLTIPKEYILFFNMSLEKLRVMGF